MTIKSKLHLLNKDIISISIGVEIIMDYELWIMYYGIYGIFANKIHGRGESTFAPEMLFYLEVEVWNVSELVSDTSLPLFAKE